MDENVVWLTYGAVPEVGRRRLLVLMKHFPTAQAAWEASLAELAVVPLLGARLAAALVAARRQPSGAALLERLAQQGGAMVWWRDPGYPLLLKEIPLPPPYFFRLGPAPLDRPAVAVVGSRKANAYGLTVARRLGKELAQAGLMVVSGLARGIDGAAHAGALEAGGSTVAVLGCGPDVIYPREHRWIYEQIRATGCIVSEFPPGTPVEDFRFPERNRIISGLCSGVVVVQAGEHSGTHHTVRAALDQGRDVMAVPGPITDELSRGPNELIRDGAVLVESAADVVQAMSVGAATGPGGGRRPVEPGPDGPAARGTPTLPPLSADEALLYGWLGQLICSLDDLVAGTGLSTQAVAAALTLLEVKGLIRELPGGQVART